MNPYKEGILAGLALDDEFSNPYHVSLVIANRDHDDWDAGYKIGLKLRTLLEISERENS